MTDRERLLYVGDHDLFLPGSVAPRPDLCTPGDDGGGGTVVEVNLDAVPLLIARGDFTLYTGPVVEVPLAVEEPIPLDRLIALEATAPTQGTTTDTGTSAPEPSAEETLKGLTGQALTDALADAGLPQHGDEDAKRERLRIFFSAEAAQIGTSTTALSLDAIRQAQAEQDAQRRINTTREN